MEKIKQSDLRELEKYLDQVWGMLDIDVSFTRHFLDRVNDPRNGKQITFAELRKLFVDTFKKHGTMFSRMGKKDDEVEGVITDVSTKINSPFVLKWDSRNREFDLVAKTVMRKSNFRPNNSREKQFRVESLSESKAWIKKHPAVQNFEDYPGDYFVNLKPGYEWSGQRSFGAESIKELVKLLKQVELKESNSINTHNNLMENIKEIIRKNKR